uniref:PRE_C2HC domain-containing protein n=1 Tax=Meloidogyne hapla TaxID=6305 RepID=A0A1I8BBK3_MELHA
MKILISIAGLPDFGAELKQNCVRMIESKTKKNEDCTLKELLNDCKIFLATKKEVKLLSEPKQEERRRHTVVITNLPESTDNTPTQRAQSDINFVHQMLDNIGLDSELPTNVFRMGRKRDDGNRLLKIEFPTKFATRYFLKNRHKIKSISTFKNVNIRESLSRSQLDARHKLISSCNEQRNATGKDFVVYAGMVVLRDTIPAIRQQN